MLARTLVQGVCMLALAMLFSIGKTATAQGFSKRVVGGTAAQDGDFPYTVFVSTPSATNNTACAGAILTDQLIVTSAYCVYDPATGQAVDPSTVNVGFGKSNKADQPNTSVLKIIINSTYNATSGVDDIALLQVNLTKFVSSTVNRIPVYIGDIFSGESLSFMGWGSSQKIGIATSNTLNYANLTVGDDTSCGGVDLFQNSNGRAICTRNKLTPGVGPCLGDYGGPLVIYDKGVAKLVGVLSTFATPNGQALDYCGNNNTLAYYTHISYYLPFLQQKTALSADAFTGNTPLVPLGDDHVVAPSHAKLSKAAIAGIVVAAVAFITLIVSLVVVIRHSARKRRDIHHEQQIYELGLQQLADELGGSYEPKTSSTMSAFHSSIGTPHDNDGFLSNVSARYRYARHSTYSDNSEPPFAEHIPQMTDVGTELGLDTLSKTHRHTDGSPKVMDYICPSRDAKVSDYYRHLLFYPRDSATEKAAENADDGNLISF